MRFSSREIVLATGGEVLAEAGVGAICTDTRAIEAGDWFLAIVGDRFNGHEFLSEAQKRGACELSGGGVRVR